MNVSLVGSANAKLAGKTQEADRAGARHFDARARLTFRPNDATIGAEGAATIDANVTNSVKVDAIGPATIRFTGRPPARSRSTDRRASAAAAIG